MQLFRPPALRFFIIGQLCYYGLVAVCAVLLPSALSANYGLSFFEDNAITILPYSLGLLLYVLFTARAGQALMSAPRKLLPVALGAYLFAILMLGILVTPHTLGTQISHIHVALGNLLFGSQLLLAVYATLVLQRSWLNWLLVLAEAGGGVLAILSLLHHINWLLQSQVMSEAAFGIIIIRVLWQQLGNTAAS